MGAYSIMMLMKFSDLSQSDRSNWPGKNGFHKKYKNLDNIAVYFIASLKLEWKNKQIKNMNNWIW